MRSCLALFVIILVFVVAFDSPVWASGFFIYHQDSKAKGQGGAFTAQADNPSAIYYNPAGISQLDGTQVSVTGGFFRIETEYKNTQGLKEDLEASWEVIPNAFITSDLGTEKWTVGIGVFAPFGLSTKWKDTGLLRYVDTYSTFKMIDINPTVAFQLLPELSVAAGIDYYNAFSVITEGKYNYVIQDADVKLDMSDDGWGFNLGGLWKPHPQHSFGLSYRSKVDLELTGDLKYKNIPPGLGYPATVTYQTKSDMTLPSIVNGGYAFKPTDKLKLEFDIYWVEWSTIDKDILKEKSTGAILVSEDKDWKDTWIFALGGEYLINPQLALRAGYCYQLNAVPEKTFKPNVPDSNLHMINLGLGYTIERFTVDVSYSLGLYDERDIDNTVGSAVGATVDGKYDSLVHVIGATVGCKF